MHKLSVLYSIFDEKWDIYRAYDVAMRARVEHKWQDGRMLYSSPTPGFQYLPMSIYGRYVPIRLHKCCHKRSAEIASTARPSHWIATLRRQGHPPKTMWRRPRSAQQWSEID